MKKLLLFVLIAGAYAHAMQDQTQPQNAVPQSAPAAKIDSLWKPEWFVRGGTPLTGLDAETRAELQEASSQADYLAFAMLNSRTPLAHAAVRGDLEQVRALLAAGADVNECLDGNDSGHVVRTHSGNASVKPYGVLSVAARRGDITMMQALLDHKTDVMDIETPFEAAVCCGNVAAAELLYKHGADPLTRNSQRYTYLIDAVYGNHYEMAKWLINHGVDDKTAFVCRPLSGENMDPALVALLLDNGADLYEQEPDDIPTGYEENDDRDEGDGGRMPDPDGNTILCHAAYCNDTTLLKLLIDRGVDVNRKKEGLECNTALHVAVLSGSVESVRMLVANGADIHAINAYKDETSYDLARRYAQKGRYQENKEIFEILQAEDRRRRKQSKIKGIPTEDNVKGITL